MFLQSLETMQAYANPAVVTSGIIQLPVTVQPYILPAESIPQAIPYKLYVSDWLSHWQENYSRPPQTDVIPVTVTEYPQPGLVAAPSPTPAPAAPAEAAIVPTGTFDWLKAVPTWAKVGAVGLFALLLMRR
jgi:hypothetical protein